MQYVTIDPAKMTPYCIIITIHGDKIPYPPDSGFPAVTLLEAKIIFQQRHLNPWFTIYLRRYQRLFIWSPMERF